MYQTHPTTRLDELLERIEEQQQALRNTCTCGKPGAVYADDGRTPLCGRCWWQIYGSKVEAQP